MEQRKELTIKKMKEKKSHYSELIEIENLKYKLLKKFVDGKENQRSREISDSD